MRAAALLPPVLAVSALAAQARADEQAERLATCEPVMTLVREGCEIDNVRRCPDRTFHTETLSPDGSVSMELNDAEGGIVYSLDPATGEGWRRTLETERAFSLTELLETGSSSGAYVAELQLIFPHPRPGRAFLKARLTDGTRDVGGVTFRVGTAEMGMEMGTGGLMAVVSGPLLVDPERRLLALDAGTLSFNGASMPTGDAIRDVLLPGESGFMSDAPLAICGPQLSKARR